MNHFSRLASMALLTVSLTAAADMRPTIVGGTEAAPGEFPFIVSLHESGGHVCGGSLIKKNWVLTAGHCVSGIRINTVYIGLHDQKSKGNAEAITPKKIIRHPQYNTGTTDYDYALIELSKDSTFTPVEYNTDEIVISDDPGKQITSTTAGWGETNVRGAADRLQRVDVPLATTALCEKGYPGNITDRMICAGFTTGKFDACFGDSGGPLLVKDANTGANVLVGIVSWGEGCARPNKLGVYSKVNAVAEWIKTTAL
jgi:trypsin